MILVQYERKESNNGKTKNKSEMVAYSKQFRVFQKRSLEIGFFSIFIDIFLQLWYYISGKRFRLSTNHCAFLKVKTTISYKVGSSFIISYI